ncbi:MAG: transporter substrate-binding protein [Firmicutes bacterium]|nr:transporter substrate-binding protein [Bacillota bacterium]
MRLSLKWVSLLLVMAIAAGCGAQASKSQQFAATGGKVKVAASFYPMYEMTRAIGGDHVDAVNLVPPGTEPHDWEPTAGDIKTLNSATLFVYNGAGLEHWVDKTMNSLDNKALIVVEASKGLGLVKAPADQGSQAWDPHVWLDPLSLVKEVVAVRDGLIKVDGAHKADYEANAVAYIDKLKALDQEYAAGLKGCTKQDFFTSHAAFGYLAQRYGLIQHPMMGLAPDVEPQPKELAQIVKTAQEQHIKYIFFETLVSDKVSKTVAQEVGAQTLVLNPFEGLTPDEVKAGKDYFAVMRENLANLKIALECGK